MRPTARIIAALGLLAALGSAGSAQAQAELSAVQVAAGLANPPHPLLENLLGEPALTARHQLVASGRSGPASDSVEVFHHRHLQCRFAHSTWVKV